MLGTQEDAGEVHVHDRTPLLDRQGIDGETRRRHPGVVEQHVQTSEGGLGLREQLFDRPRIGHVGRHDERAAGRIRQPDGFVERVLTATSHDDPIALAKQAQGNGAPDPAAGPGDHRDSEWCTHQPNGNMTGVIV